VQAVSVREGQKKEKDRGRNGDRGVLPLRRPTENPKGGDRFPMVKKTKEEVRGKGRGKTRASACCHSDRRRKGQKKKNLSKKTKRKKGTRTGKQRRSTSIGKVRSPFLW